MNDLSLILSMVATHGQQPPRRPAYGYTSVLPREREWRPDTVVPRPETKRDRQRARRRAKRRK